MIGLKRILGGTLVLARATGIAMAVASVVLLGACGQKGPLIQRTPAPGSAQTGQPALPTSSP